VQSDEHQRYPKKYPNQRGKVRRPVRPQHKTPEVQPEVQPVVQPEVKPKSHFDGCLYTHGLGFLSSTMIEPRFNDDNFFGRMVRMLVDTRDGEGSPTRGIGIDREMALAVYRIGSRDEFAEVLGTKGGITLINVTAVSYDATATLLNISNVDVTFLGQDDRIILKTDEVLPATWKADLHGEERHVLAESSDDVFQQQVAANQHPKGGFSHVAKRLFNSALSYRVECRTPAVSASLQRRLGVAMDRRSAEAFHNDSPTTAQHVISYAHLRVDIYDISDNPSSQ